MASTSICSEPGTAYGGISIDIDSLNKERCRRSMRTALFLYMVSPKTELLSKKRLKQSESGTKIKSIYETEKLKKR